jgi:hypothetical protein
MIIDPGRQQKDFFDLLPALGGSIATYRAKGFTIGYFAAQRWTVGTQAVVRPPMVS